MASKIKADQFETLDGSGNITLNNSVTMASGKTLPAASLTGALPAISGASLTGVTSVGGATGVDFNDNVAARWGTGNDLSISTNGSNSYINNTGSGDLLIRGNDVKIQGTTSSESMAHFVEDGAVELYHNNVKKLETSAAGGTLTGTWTGAGKVKNTWYINSTGSSQTINSGSWTTVGCSASLSVTSGNTLIVWCEMGVNSSSASHYTFAPFFNGGSISDGSWGPNIFAGSASRGNGWHNHTNIGRKVLSATGSYTLEIKAKCNSGSFTIRSDGNTGSGWGYDGIHMIAMEVGPN